MNRPMTSASLRQAIDFQIERLQQLRDLLPAANDFARECQGELAVGSRGERGVKGGHSDPTANAGADTARADREKVAQLLRGGGPIDASVAMLQAFAVNYTRPDRKAQPNPNPIRSTVAPCPVCGLPLEHGSIKRGMCKNTCYQAWRRAGKPSPGTAPFSAFLDEYAGATRRATPHP